MTQKAPIHATITETGQSPYAVAIDVSGHKLTGDEPGVSGHGLGPSPYDLLTAALGECTAMTMRWYALEHQWPLEKVEVKLTHRKEGRQDIFDKTIMIYGPQLSEEQRQKLIEISAKCPVQRTLENTPFITTKTVP